MILRAERSRRGLFFLIVNNQLVGIQGHCEVLEYEGHGCRKLMISSLKESHREATSVFKSHVSLTVHVIIMYLFESQGINYVLSMCVSLAT